MITDLGSKRVLVLRILSIVERLPFPARRSRRASTDVHDARRGPDRQVAASAVRLRGPLHTQPVELGGGLSNHAPTGVAAAATPRGRRGGPAPPWSPG